MKYIIYLRVSTEKQDERTQLEKCLQFLKSHDTSDFQYEVYSDTISSRKSLSRRVGMQTALAATQKGDILVAMRLDRIARKAAEIYEILGILEKKDADIVFIEQPGIKNRVTLAVYAGMAEEEVKLIRSRIKEKLDVKKLRNERVSGRVPYGFTIHPTERVWVKDEEGKPIQKLGLLVPEPKEQQTISHMIRLYQEGKTYSMITRILSSWGYTNREGKPFAPMSILRVLKRLGHSNSSDQPQEKKLFELYHSR